MPLYEFQCDACGQRFEVIQKFSDAQPDVCRKCGKGPIHKLQSSPAIQFKGSGFYITDYAQKGKSSGSATVKGGESSPAAGESKGEAGKSESGKSESSSESSKTESSSTTKSETATTPSKKD